LGVVAVGRYVSEAWFGRQLARHPPAYQRVRNGSAQPLADPPPSSRHGQPELVRQARPELIRSAGMALIITGTVLLLAVSMVSISLPFLNVKLLGLIMIVTGLVKVRALRRASSWLWRNRRMRNEPPRPPAGPAPSLRHGQPELVRQARPELTRPAGTALIFTGTVLLLAVSISFPFLNVKLLGLIMIVTWAFEARALQRVFSWLWQNRRKVMAARVPLDTPLEASAPVAGQLAGGRDVLCYLATPEPRQLEGVPLERPAPHGYRNDGPHAGRHRGRGVQKAAPSSGWQPTATALIPAHNEEATIGEVVRACIESGYPLEDIFVVADSCTDRTAQVAWEAGATLVLETTFTDKAGAQNAALPYVESDVVVGFDGDTMPQRDCISLMMADIAAGADATCSTILPVQPHGFFVQGRRFAYALGRRWWRLCQAQVGRIQVLTGASYAFRTEAIRGIGGFPAGLISADMDATWALHRARKRLAYTAEALSLTVEPETLRVYRAQMRRWSSGYFQNVARYKREVLHWRSALVIWTALFDLGCLFAYEALFTWSLISGRYLLMQTFALWLVIHAVVTTTLVATVVGPRRAILGWFPYFVLNYYNKWLYLCAFGREWILGRHYAAWTGRQGRKTVITPMTTQRKIALSCILGAILGTTGCVAAVRHTFTAPSSPPPVASSSPPVASSPPPVATVVGAYTSERIRYLGVVTQHSSAADLTAFASLTGIRPNMDEYYVTWGRPFDPARAAALEAAGAIPLISWEPTTTSLQGIADGVSDLYVRSWASAVASYGKPIVVTFGSEMNGHWENWGPGRATPRQFVAAWRHIHRLFAAVGARNVTWVWTANVINGLRAPLRPYWPGARYVNWVGMDGYWWGAHRRPGTTFAAIFGPTMRRVRTFSKAPFLIAETGGLGRFRQVAARDLFRSVEHTPDILGFVWFDDVNSQGDWRLETDSAAVVAFRRGVASMKAACRSC
jgi:cellulose synthase/poly-beta-1,6-N-acetylglucosamine synthase-like glycosyltransferase